MAGGKEPIEVKFRLFDGTDIGPSKYDPSTTVAALKEFVLARWPQGCSVDSCDRLIVVGCSVPAAAIQIVIQTLVQVMIFLRLITRSSKYPLPWQIVYVEILAITSDGWIHLLGVSSSLHCAKRYAKGLLYLALCTGRICYLLLS